MALLVDYFQSLIPAAAPAPAFNSSGLILFPVMHAFTSLALLGACAVHSVLGLPNSNSKREAEITKRNVDSWINTETPIAWQKLLCNIGPNGCAAQGVASGTVVASPSKSNPDYWYTWTRDSALVFKNIADAFAHNYTADLQTQVKNFIIANARLQGVGNPSGGLSDGQGLGEAKFHVDLSQFTGEWGRPQRDGPPLRAIAMIRYAKWLIQNGYKSTALSAVWPTIKNDLSYTAQYWNETGFDLWEEVPGSSFFTITSSHRALVEGAELAANLGQPTRVYTTVAPHVLCFQQRFWNNAGYMVSNINGGEYRSGKDANSILASIHNFDADVGCDANTFQPCSDKALSNHKAVVDSFRSIYRINQGIPQGKAVAVGRYSEDVYYNGNPWFLTTFAAAEQLYDAVYVWNKQGTITVTSTSLGFFRDLVSGINTGTYSAGSSTFNQIISAVSTYADGFIEINSRYAHSNGAMPEQYERNSGAPLAAPDLTWSYASFLTATYRRAGIVPTGWSAASGNTLPSTCQLRQIAGTYSQAPTPAFPANQTPQVDAAPAETAIPTGCTNPEQVFVTFNHRANTAWGQNIRVVGNVPELGNWNTARSIPLSASGYKSNDPLWSVTIPIAAGSSVQYKYIRVQGSQVTWESDPNRSLSVGSATCDLKTQNDNWK
ncbi:family 15 putative glycoside hydrolase [Cladorrhinum sp. PSN332]|nr:family 15 putative glycoside hydrolase [Cladorrhinum sp. PSN332]